MEKNSRVPTFSRFQLLQITSVKSMFFSLCCFFIWQYRLSHIQGKEVKLWWETLETLWPTESQSADLRFLMVIFKWKRLKSDLFSCYFMGKNPRDTKSDRAKKACHYMIKYRSTFHDKIAPCPAGKNFIVIESGRIVWFPCKARHGAER